MTDFRQLLKESNFTAVRLARELKVTNMTVGRWVNGETVPNIEQAQLISRIIHKPIHVVSNAIMATRLGGRK